MEAERLIDYEHEKQQERKRKGAHLEAIFEQNAKKPSAQDTNQNNIKNRMINSSSENGTLASASSSEIDAHSGKLENAGKPSARSRNSGSTESTLGNPENTFGDTGNLIGNPRSPSGNSVNPLRHTRVSIGNAGSRMEHARNSSGISGSPLGKATNSMENASRGVSYPNDHDPSCVPRERLGSNLRSPERQTESSVSESHQYTGFKQIESSSLNSSPAKEKQSKGSEFQNAVTIKQEKTDDSPPVQDMSLPSQVSRKKSSTDDHGEIGDECLKFLLFSGKLYHCERVSDLTHSFSKFIGDSVLGRKGKVVVLLLFHKTLREVLNYVVGVVDHYTLEEHNIIIKIIKHHTYPTTTIPAKEVEKSASKLVVGSKKLLYNLQPLHGPVYGELVKILDGFGANSAVDHAKISEFNAMVNANADRMDGQISNILGGVGYPYRGTFANRNFVPPGYNYIGSCFPQSNPRYSPQANQPSRYSPEKSHGASTHDRSKSVDGEIQNGYQRRANTSYYRGHHVNTVSANQTVRITPRTANSNVDHIRTASAVPITPNSRFRSIEDGSLSSQRRNVEDLQTVAELCKEKMKRDMAEQELKSIKAAFEEFKSQMQQHLSQVEERMVVLEAENRTLKGKLSNMHQNNGFAEKKYHELRSQLEDLLKST